MSESHLIARLTPGRAAEDGGALIVVTLSLAVLCIVAGTLLSYTTAKQAAPFQAASWQEAGTAAESGVELALSALRRSLDDGTTAWGGWDATAAEGGSTMPFSKKYSTPDDLLSHTGEGNTKIRAVVEVSVPTGPGTVNPLQGGLPISPNKWAYIIRATGIANVPGPVRVPLTKPDQALRKLSFLSDFRTKSKVEKGVPQVARVIEAIASPVTPFGVAILARERIEFKSGSAMVVDSYEPSQAPLEVSKASDIPNPYSPVRLANGSIATNGKKKDIIRLENVKIQGDAAKGSGEINMKSNASISGRVIDGFYQNLQPVSYPGTRIPAFSPIELSPTTANRVKTVTLKASLVTVANPTPAPLYYKLDKIHLHDKEVLNITKTGLDGGVAEIWVTGDVVIHNGGQIKVDNGVKAIFYCEKNITLQEKDEGKPAVLNLATKLAGSNTVPDPEALQIYGVSPTKKAKKRKFKIKTNLVALVYAPDHEFEIKLKKGGDPQKRAIWGSLVGRKFKVEGGTHVHYDESAGDAGKPFDYTLETWQEDWFDPSNR